MRKISLFFFCVLFYISVNHAQDLSTDKYARTLIETEFTFAQKAADTNTRTAFLEFIDDEGIIFRPGPVNGKEFLQKSKPNTALLTWYPSFSRISSAGDMGFNMGPWEWRKTKSDTVAYTGYFCTVWKRQKDDSWKFLIDFGNQTNKTATKAEPLKPQNITYKDISLNSEKTSATVMTLFSLDKQINPDNQQNYLYEDSRFIRDNFEPVTGSSNILNYISTQQANRIDFEPVGGQISKDGDFGFTYGKGEANVPDKTVKYNYVHVWKTDKTGAWKILADIMSEAE